MITMTWIVELIEVNSIYYLRKMFPKTTYKLSYQSPCVLQNKLLKYGTKINTEQQ